MQIQEIKDDKKKLNISREILEDLKDWFEIESAREAYIKESQDQLFYCAYYDLKAVGFLTLKETGNKTMEIGVIGVLRDYHQKGIGRALIDTARKDLKLKTYDFLQVKTLAMGKDKYYDKTNLFYQKIGFSEFELIVEIWGEENPCQIYIIKTGDKEPW